MYGLFFATISAENFNIGSNITISKLSHALFTILIYIHKIHIYLYTRPEQVRQRPGDYDERDK